MWSVGDAVSEVARGAWLSAGVAAWTLPFRPEAGLQNIERIVEPALDGQQALGDEAMSAESDLPGCTM